MTTCYHDNHGKIPGTGVHRGSRSNISHDCQGQGPNDVKRRIPEPVRRPIIGNHEDHADNVRRNRQQKRIDPVESERLNNSREKVRCSTGNLDAEKGQGEDIQPPVCKRLFESVQPPAVIRVHLSSVRN